MMSKKDAAILALQLSLQSFGDILYRWMPIDGWKDYIKICVNEEYTNKVVATAFSALMDGSGKKISDMNGKDFKFCHQKKWVGGKNVLFYLLHPQTKNTDYKPDEPKNTAGWQEIIDGYPNYLPKRKKPDRGQQQKRKKEDDASNDDDTNENDKRITKMASIEYKSIRFGDGKNKEETLNIDFDKNIITEIHSTTSYTSVLSKTYYS